jgi:hypothetical protein
MRRIDYSRCSKAEKVEVIEQHGGRDSSSGKEVVTRCRGPWKNCENERACHLLDPRVSNQNKILLKAHLEAINKA